MSGATQAAPATAALTIGFVGLGRMGGPMAGNLVAAGHRVRGFDVAAAARDAAAREHGVEAVATLGAAADEADVVITMLQNGDQLRACYAGPDGLVAAASPGALLIDCSTVDVASSRAAHDIAQMAGLGSVDAPVSGGVPGAQAATLTFMAGGDDEDYARAEPLLAAMGARTVHCGPPTAGQAAKLCNNMILGISMIAVSEAFVLAEALGLSHAALYDVASSASGQCWSLTSYCPVPGPVPASPANHDYRAGFMTDLMVKDLALAHAAARDGAVAADLGAHALEVYRRMSDAGEGARDFSAVIEWIRARGEQTTDRPRQTADEQQEDA